MFIMGPVSVFVGNGRWCLLLTPVFFPASGLRPFTVKSKDFLLFPSKTFGTLKLEPVQCSYLVNFWTHSSSSKLSE